MQCHLGRNGSEKIAHEFCWFAEDNSLPFHLKVVRPSHSIAPSLFPNNKEKGDIIRGDFSRMDELLNGMKLRSYTG